MHADDVRLAHGARNFVQIVAEGQGTGRQRWPAARIVGQVRAAFPRARGGCLATRMRNLDSRHRAVRFDETIDARNRFNVFVRPDARVAWRDAAFRRNRRGLGDDQSRAAQGARTQMHQMPVGGHAVIRRILAHGRHADAIAQRDRFDGERLKEMGRAVSFFIHRKPLYHGAGGKQKISGLSKATPSLASKRVQMGDLVSPTKHFWLDGHLCGITFCAWVS